jgi:Protein of unknown function (DUF3500)
MAIAVSVTHRAPATAQRMAEAALRFRDSLNDAQRKLALFPFEGEERYFWHYTPVFRNGLRLMNMNQEQKRLALALFDVGLSARGARTANDIIALEPDLREAERIEGYPSPFIRDPELYWFSIFGEPGGADPWAWRAGGHHIGLHFTIVDRDQIAPTPLFFGANPAQVRHGPRAGFRTLPEEEDRARALLRSFDAEQRAAAVFDAVAPHDLLTENHRRAEPWILPRGLAFSAMSGEQRGRLVDLVRYYVEHTTEELARNEWARIEEAGLDTVTFAWAGPAEVGAKHYYNVRGPFWMIEYDNTQNEGNHIHSVWRHFTNDWGEDLLAQHYLEAH